MTYHLGDTIAAAATAPQGAARAIVRLSGPGAWRAAGAIFAACDGGPLEAATTRLRGTHAVAGQIKLAEPLLSIDATAYLWPPERSLTREPIVELYLPGSPPLIEAVLAALAAQNVRMAEPGEFTLRAFLAGRIDLTEAEAVLGVIDAGSDEQLRTALVQLAGGLATPLAALRGNLLDLLAELEAGLDFVDEDIEFITRDVLVARLGGAMAIVEEISKQLVGRHTPGRLPRVALYGWPNVGKSRLLNALIDREAALVADRAGTTRDYLVARVECAGVACELIDTPGFESATDLAELPGVETSIRKAAQKLALDQQASADLLLLCLDRSRPLNDWEVSQLERHGLIVWTKCDLPPAAADIDGALATSSVDGRGLTHLREAIATRITAGGTGSAVASTAARCGQNNRQAAAALARARELAVGRGGEELVAAELRIALQEVAQMAGAVYTDDILDRIFSRFCIGK